MLKVFCLFLLLVTVSCSEDFRIIRSNLNKSDNSYSLTTTPIELAVSGMTDIYSYKIFMTMKYNKYPNDESYSMLIKHYGISILNLERAYFEINGNTIDLKTSRAPIIKQDGVDKIAEIYSFQISKENISALINENDSRLIFRSGQRIINMAFDEGIRQKLKEFIENTLLRK